MHYGGIIHNMFKSMVCHRGDTRGRSPALDVEVTPTDSDALVFLVSSRSLAVCETCARDNWDSAPIPSYRRIPKCSGDGLTATCAPLGIEASRTAPRLRFVRAVVWSSVELNTNTRNSGGARPQNWTALLCEQHSGVSLPGTEVGRKMSMRHSPFMETCFIMLLLSVTNHVLDSVQTVLCDE